MAREDALEEGDTATNDLSVTSLEKELKTLEYRKGREKEKEELERGRDLKLVGVCM